MNCREKAREKEKEKDEKREGRNRAGWREKKTRKPFLWRSFIAIGFLRPYFLYNFFSNGQGFRNL